MRHGMHYETDNEAFSADAYQVDGWRGIAWHVLGWQTEPDEDTEWSGCENRTGKVVCRMVGDDRDYAYDPDEIIPLAEDAYCRECGQVGCTHGAISCD